MKPVFIKKEKDAAKQSKAFTRYEKLLSEIEKQQQFTANITEGLRKAAAKINEELSPLEKEVHLLNRSYIIRLDELSTEIGIGKYNREWFEKFIGDELDSLLDFFGHQDEILSKLYEKYLGVSVDDIAVDDDILETVKSLSDRFGFTVDVKEFLKKGERAYFEEYKHKIAECVETANDFFSEDNVNGENNSKKKSQNLKPTQEDVVLAKDARNIYIRLIKKFHPDLEIDPVVIERKNEIVKQVTKAYQENDFFGLLKLQIIHLEDNETEAEKIADEMIKRYTKILQKQLNEINRHIHEMHFIGGAVIENFIDKNGKFSAQKFAARKRAIDETMSQLSNILEDSKKRPKGWFKDQISFIRQTMQQNMMEDAISDMFVDFDF